MSTDTRASNRNAYELANDADVTTPDTPTSAGAKFLLSVQDAINELIESNPDADADELRDDVHEAIDGLVPIYTYEKWMTFIDLAAWQEDLSEWSGKDADLDSLSDLALWQIADRLAYRLIDAYEETKSSVTEGG